MNPLEINKNPENTELMTIKVQDESQLKGLLDDEEYETFVKNLEDKEQKEEQKNSSLSDLFTGKSKSEDKKTAEKNSSPAPQEAFQVDAGGQPSKPDTSKAELGDAKKGA